MSMVYCPSVVGVDAIACISQQTNYIIGYVLLVLLVGLLFFRLSREPTRERFASIMIVLAVLTSMGAVNNMLFPTHFFIISAVLAMGAVFLLVARK